MRIISAAAGMALLALVMLLPKEILGVVVFLLALTGLHEFFNAVEAAGHRPVRAVGYLSALPLLFIAFYGTGGVLNSACDTSEMLQYIFAGVFIILLALSIHITFFQGKYNIDDISLTFYGIFYTVFLFSFLTLTRYLEEGNYFVYLVFIGAWVTDTFAYFTGKTIGKRKLIPKVSPNKTVEGAVGGVIGCAAAITVYGIFINRYIVYIPVYHYVIIGVLCGFVSQLGDLAASAVKRYAKIKDFGRIMPGHGGVLDRFDSMLFIAPLIYFYISLIK